MRDSESILARTPLEKSASHVERRQRSLGGGVGPKGTCLRLSVQDSRPSLSGVGSNLGLGFRV